MINKLKRPRIKAQGLKCLLALALLATAMPVGAQEFVLPDFGDNDPVKKAKERRAEAREENAQSSSPDMDFFDDGDFSSSDDDENYNFEKTPEEIQEELRQQSYDAAIEGLLPLRPSEIRELLERFDRTQESVELPVYPAPRPEVAVETLSLEPGTKPTTIKVAHGYVTTLNILDSTGSPWPIEDITWAGNFEVIEVSGEGAHFIRITPQSEYAYGNMSIHLTSLQTPIIISLETSRDFVHYRFDAIVPEAGPFAKAPIIQSGLSVTAGDIDMAGFLEGVLPDGASRMSVSGVDSRTSAYTYDGLTYLRTPLTLLSPAWVSSASSADGMRVYALSDAPVLLLSEKGRTVRARLSARGDIIDE